MTDYLIMYQITVVVVAIAFIIAGTFLFLRYAPFYMSLSESAQKMIKKTRNVLIVTILIGFGIYLFSSGVVNVAPRKVIDRSEVIKQQQDFERRHTK